MEGLLSDVKNYLDITYEDPETDKKIMGIIQRGKKYLDKHAGTEQDYSEEGTARALLFDYCRYARGNVLEMFEENYMSDLISMRAEAQADEYAKGQGYI